MTELKDKTNHKIFSVWMTYDDMNLIYQKLQQSNISDEDLRRIEVAFRLSQLSYGNSGAFYD
jgi:hypothetical protein